MNRPLTGRSTSMKTLEHQLVAAAGLYQPPASEALRQSILSRIGALTPEVRGGGAWLSWRIWAGGAGLAAAAIVLVALTLGRAQKVGPPGGPVAVVKTPTIRPPFAAPVPAWRGMLDQPVASNMEGLARQVRGSAGAAAGLLPPLRDYVMGIRPAGDSPVQPRRAPSTPTPSRGAADEHPC